LEKSPALHDYLLDKNYTIIATMVPVGDIVEYAVDWVVDLVTVVSSTLLYYVGNLNDRVDLAEYKISLLYDDHQQLKADIANLDYLTLWDYYDLKFQHDKEIIIRICEFTDPIQADLINHIAHYEVLKDLVMELTRGTDAATYNFNISLVNLGGRVENLETEVGYHKNIFQLTWDFFSDPVLWAYEVVDGIIERFF